MDDAPAPSDTDPPIFARLSVALQAGAPAMSHTDITAALAELQAVHAAAEAAIDKASLTLERADAMSAALRSRLPRNTDQESNSMQLTPEELRAHTEGANRFAHLNNPHPQVRAQFEQWQAEYREKSRVERQEKAQAALDAQSARDSRSAKVVADKIIAAGAKADGK